MVMSWLCFWTKAFSLLFLSCLWYSSSNNLETFEKSFVMTWCGAEIRTYLLPEKVLYIIILDITDFLWGGERAILFWVAIGYFCFKVMGQTNRYKNHFRLYLIFFVDLLFILYKHPPYFSLYKMGSSLMDHL